MATYEKIEGQVYEVTEVNIPVSSADVQLQIDDLTEKKDELIAQIALLETELTKIIIAEEGE